MKRFMKSAFRCGVIAGTFLLGIVSAAHAAGDAAAAKGDYQELCEKCHGKEGKGDGPEAATLKTRPANYTDCAKMKTYSDADLFAVIDEGGPARHLSRDMAPFGDVLEKPEITNLVAYIRNFCQKP